MACSITNVQVVAVGPPGGSSSSITISGNAPDCAKLSIKFSCGGTPFTGEASPDPANGGFFTVTFSNPVCACTKLYNLEIVCESDSACRFTESKPLQCSQPEGCPVVVSSTITPAMDCNADGTRTVSFSITITNNSGSTAVVALEFETGIFGMPVVINNGTTLVLNQSFNYLPGTYTAYLTFSEPPGCSPIPFPITVPPCGPVCLEALDITVTISPMCNPDGTRQVTFTWPFPVPAVTVDFGDGSSPITIGGTTIGKGYTPPGPYTASFQVPGCPQVTVTFGPLPGCEAHITGACCLPDKSCTVTTPADCTQKNGTYKGDGSTCAGANCNPGNGGGLGCGAFLYGIAVLSVLTLVSTLVMLCLNCIGVAISGWIIAALAGALAAIAAAIIAWEILCHIFSSCKCPNKCDWLVITWVPTLAGGFMALFLSGCCPWLLWIGIGLFATAVATFGLWIKECSPSKCRIFTMLSLSIVTGVVTGFAYITLIPALAACGLNWVKVATTTLAGLITIAAAAACAGE